MSYCICVRLSRLDVLDRLSPVFRGSLLRKGSYSLIMFFEYQCLR